MRGSAVIGRALDLSIPVQFGAGEAVSSDCVTAQVFYAEARQSSVKVSVLPGEGTLTGSVVRVQSATAINEPVVTLEVSATCGSSTRRSYVLLADFPPVAASQWSPDAAPAPPVVVLSTAIIPESTSALTSLNASRVGNATPAAVKARPRKSSARPTEAATAAGASGKAVVRKAAVAVSNVSVLKLDPSDFFSDRIDLLDSTILLAPTEEALRQSSQITSLEGDVKSLRALAASNDARMSDLTAKLQEARANQMPAWLTYAFTGLVALLLVCLAALLWLWLQLKRRGQQDPAQGWWQGAADQENAPLTEHLAPAAHTDAPAQPVPSAEPGGQPISVQAESTPVAPMAKVDINFGSELLEEPLDGTFEASTADAPLESNNIRHISVEPILDIRQQAEFFVSLGQTDRALLILNKQIAESSEPNPLVYLDLITLYHSLGMKAEFRELSSAFHQLFNGVIPDFSAFNLEGRDLEAYPEVLASLRVLWPGMDALVFLSACVFRDANAQHEGMFDLAAFRDLLMLHAQLETLLIDLPASAQTPELVMMAPVIPVALGLVAADEPPSGMPDLDFSSFTEPAPPHQKN